MLSPDNLATSPESGETPVRVAVVGSRGRMGAMLMRRLAEAGYDVEGIDDATDGGGADVQEILSQTRIVLLCVPVGAIRACLSGLSAHLKPGHLLMDITSVKVLPMRWMEELFSGAVVGTHPMFGPNPREEDMRVALVRGAKASADDCTLASALFESFGCQTFWSSAAEHDSGVGLSQSLNFAVSAAFLATLARHEGIGPYLTPSFKRHLEAARMHLTKDAGMFLEFSAMNPAFPAALEEFGKVLAEIDSGRLNEIAVEAAAWYRAPTDPNPN